jgi:hypothetical protein
MTSDTAAFLDRIDELLGDGRHDWAVATLKGIAATVRSTDWVTRAQREAVENIAAGDRSGLLPSQRFRGSRRYEGWAPEGRG